MARKSKRSYTSDFETTVDENGARVWAWNLYDIEADEIVSRGTSMESWWQYVWKLCSNTSADIYFHNLSFDGTFILDYVLRNKILRHSDVLDIGTFTTLISDQKVWYNIKFCTKVQKKRKVTINIMDSYKKLPFSAKTIGEKWLEGEVTKGELDYSKNRPIGYVPDDEEWDYIDRDSRIIGRALRILHVEGNSKMTAPSDAMFQFKQIIGAKQEGQIFPKLPVSTSDYLRPAYRGGYVFIRPDRREVLLGAGKVYDINSMYPWAMYTCPMPFGYPVKFEGKYPDNSRYNLYVQRFLCSFVLKPNHLPTIQIKYSHRNEMNNYLTESDGMVELTLSNIDLELFLDHYDVTIHAWLDGYMFQSYTGFFGGYIDKWMEVKRNETGAKRELAKLMLNGLYGKYGTNPHKRKCIPRFDPEKNMVAYGDSVENESKDSVYLPVAIYITAYSRNNIIREAQKNYNEFIYCDTDSLHLLGFNHNVDIHETELGRYKIEHEFDKAKYIRPKRYMYLLGEIWEVKCAGLPEDAKRNITIDNFHTGSEISGKRMARKIAGGTEIRETTYKLR